MTVSLLKMHFRKLPTKVISYRNFKKFENKRFMDSLHLALNSQNIDYTKNPDLFFNGLNHHAPRKKKCIRGNNKPFMTKTFLRTRFRNRFLKNPTDENRLVFTRQRNFCVSLLRKEKEQYFAKLNVKNITDNRKFWQTVKLFLSEENKSSEKITLLKNEETISDEVEVANTLKKF